MFTREEAEEYIRKHAEHSKLEKRLDELKKKILPAIVAGAQSPQDLPYLLVNRPQKRPQPDWKGYVFGFLVKLLRSKKRAEAELERIDGAWPTKEIPSLCVEKNPAYAATLGAPPA